MVWPIGYKPVRHVTVLNTVANCNTMVGIIILYYSISYIILININITIIYYYLMEPLSCKRSVVD